MSTKRPRPRPKPDDDPYKPPPPPGAPPYPVPDPPQPTAEPAKRKGDLNPPDRTDEEFEEWRDGPEGHGGKR
jgi:hypothetical protein